MSYVWHHKAAHCYYLLSHLSPPLFFSCFRNHPSVFPYPSLPFPFPLSCYQFSARNCWGWMRDETSGDSRLSRWRVSRVLTQGRRQQLMLDDCQFISSDHAPSVSCCCWPHGQHPLMSSQLACDVNAMTDRQSRRSY